MVYSSRLTTTPPPKRRGYPPRRERRRYPPYSERGRYPPYKSVSASSQPRKRGHTADCLPISLSTRWDGASFLGLMAIQGSVPKIYKDKESKRRRRKKNVFPVSLTATGFPAPSRAHLLPLRRCSHPSAIKKQHENHLIETTRHARKKNEIKRLHLNSGYELRVLNTRRYYQPF